MGTGTEMSPFWIGQGMDKYSTIGSGTLKDGLLRRVTTHDDC